MGQASSKTPIVKVETPKHQGGKWWVYSAAALLGGYMVASDAFNNAVSQAISNLQNTDVQPVQSVEDESFKQKAFETINFSLGKLDQNNQLLTAYKDKAQSGGLTPKECREAELVSSLSDEYQKTAKQANALLFLASKIDKETSDKMNKGIDAVYNKSFPLAMNIHARCIQQNESATNNPENQDDSHDDTPVPGPDGPRGLWWGNVDGLRV